MVYDGGPHPFYGVLPHEDHRHSEIAERSQSRPRMPRHHRARVGRKEERHFGWCVLHEKSFTILRNRGFMHFLQDNMRVGSFCKYGTDFRKNTCIWSNIPDLELARCTKSTPCSGCVDGKHQRRAQGGRSVDATPGVSKEEAQRAPDDLVALLSIPVLLAI